MRPSDAARHSEFSQGAENRAAAYVGEILGGLSCCDAHSRPIHLSLVFERLTVILAVIFDRAGCEKGGGGSSREEGSCRAEGGQDVRGRLEDEGEGGRPSEED
jgi:hypothetical protein